MMERSEWLNPFSYFREEKPKKKVASEKDLKEAQEVQKTFVNVFETLGAFAPMMATEEGGELLLTSLKNKDVRISLGDYSQVSSLYQETLGISQKDLALKEKAQLEQVLKMRFAGEDLAFLNEISDLLSLKSKPLKQHIAEALSHALEKNEGEKGEFRKFSHYQPYSTKVEVMLPSEEKKEPFSLTLSIAIPDSKEQTVKFDLPWENANAAGISAEDFSRYLVMSLTGSKDLLSIDVEPDQYRILASQGHLALDQLDDEISKLLLAGLKNQDVAVLNREFDQKAEDLKKNLITTIGDIVFFLSDQEMPYSAEQFDSFLAWIDTLEKKDYRLLILASDFVTPLGTSVAYIAEKEKKHEPIDPTFPPLQEVTLASEALLRSLGNREIMFGKAEGQKVVNQIMKELILQYYPDPLIVRWFKLGLKPQDLSKNQELILAQRKLMANIADEFEQKMVQIRSADNLDQLASEEEGLLDSLTLLVDQAKEKVEDESFHRLLDRINIICFEEVKKLFKKSFDEETEEKQGIEKIAADPHSHFNETLQIDTRFGPVTITKQLSKDFFRSDYIFNDTEIFGLIQKKEVGDVNIAIASFIEMLMDKGYKQGEVEKLMRFLSQGNIESLSKRIDERGLPYLFRLFGPPFEGMTQDVKYVIYETKDQDLGLEINYQKTVKYFGQGINFNGTLGFLFAKEGGHVDYDSGDLDIKIEVA